MRNVFTIATQPSSHFRLRLFLVCSALVGVVATLFLPSSPSAALFRHDYQHYFSGMGRPHEALNNGTHFWEKTVILFSIDGLKPSYLTPEQLPNLHRLSSIDDAQTLFGPSMWPVSPSLTFPNHWTLMTGLEPSSHGIVANDFLDIGKNKTFYYTDPARSWDASWWKGVPLWEAVQRQGRRSANLMWPGPPKTTRGASPDFFQEYESPRDWPMERRLAHLLRWIDLPSNQRPSFICGESRIPVPVKENGVLC